MDSFLEKTTGKPSSEETPLFVDKIPVPLDHSSSSSDVSANDLRSSDSFSAHSIFDTGESTERFKALETKGVGESAFLIRDAILGSQENPAKGAYSPYQHPNAELVNKISIICRRLCALRSNRQFFFVINTILVCLTFFEAPAWCTYYIREGEDHVDPQNLKNMGGRCGELLSMWGPAADDASAYVQYYPNAGMMLSEFLSRIIEGVCLFLLWIHILMRIGRDGCDVRRFFRAGPSRIVRIVATISMICLTVGLIYDCLTFVDQPRYLAPFWRVLIFIAGCQGVQSEFKALMAMIPEVQTVLILLFVTILFFGWFGVVGFYGSVQGQKYFPNLVDGMYTLWIMSTTANYPDVMMPAFNETRITALYFIFFMVVTFFFLINVILASVVNAYDNEMEARKVGRNDLTARNLAKAFRLLDSTKRGYISRETVMSLFWILNEDFPEFRTIPPDKAKLLFAVLDKDGTDQINKEEFMNFGNVLLLEFEKIIYHKTIMERCFPRAYRSKPYQDFVAFIKSKWFEYMVDVILVLNAVVVFIQSYSMLSGEETEVNEHLFDGVIDTVWEAVETGFTCIYVLEIFLKVLVLGWHKFSSSSKNMFDFVITVSAVVSTAYVYYPNGFSDSRLIRFIVMARVLRLCRILAAMDMFNMMARISLDVLGRASNVLLLLLCTMYCFAALGVILFGGLISRDPSDPRSFRVLNTDFSDNDYWANNFNDMFSAFNVLFNLLVINNWTECADGFEAVAQTRATRLFFIGFHIVGVLLVNNLVIAFIIDAFIKQWDFRKERLRRKLIIEGEATIQGREAVFDATRITGTKTLLSGTYVAKLDSNAHTFDMQHQQNLLKQLFTSSSSGVNDSGRKV